MAPRLSIASCESPLRVLVALALVAAACSTTPALTLTASPSSIGGDGQSTVTATAKVTAGGGPAPDGTAVTFTATDGVLETSDMTPAATPLSLEVDSSSGASTALLIVPRRGRGTVTITATASFNGATVAQSQTVTLTPAGGLASSLGFSCRTQNIGGFISPLPQPIHVSCTATAYDANNNAIPNASIETYAEAGELAWVTDTTATPVAQTLVYTVDPTSTTRPLDVDPFGPDGMPRPVCPSACINDPTTCDAEPCWVDNAGTHNPRDGVVTLMVAVPGVPGFFDQSADGEPYLDSNDNNVRDANEFYIDVNGNNMYDSASSANGAMQSTRMLWTALRMIWSGDADMTATAHGSQIIGTVSGATLNNLTVRLNDSNYNKLAATDSSDNFALTQNCVPDGTLEGLPFSTNNGMVPFDTMHYGIAFDPVTGDIENPGMPSTYRQETDVNLQTQLGVTSIDGNSGASTCAVTATVTRTYDPGVGMLYESIGPITGESVSGAFSFAAPPDAGM